MNTLKLMLLGFVVFWSSSALAQTGATVVNRDSVSHTLIIEDENEDITEVMIAAGQTLTGLCEKECYLYIDGAEDFEYVAQTPVTYLIVNGQLMLEEPRATEDNAVVEMRAQ